jgi:PAS domain S-box-containing protein
MTDVTHLLKAIESGDPDACAQLLPLVYDDLRRLAAVQERLRFETLLAELSAAFVNLPPEAIDGHIESALGQIVEFLGIDRCGLGEWSPTQRHLVITHSYELAGVPPNPRVIVEEMLPWYARKVYEGEVLKLSRLPDDLPPEAVRERDFCTAQGLKSSLTVPFKVMGAIVGGICFDTFRSYRDWPDELIQRLRLVGEVFTNALVRKRAAIALSESAEQLRLVVESIPNALLMVNAEGDIILVNSQCEKFFGYRREELLGRPVEVLVPERFRAQHPGYRAGFFASPSARPMGVGRDLHGRRKNGSEFPVEIGLTPIQTGAGLRVLCVVVDITVRKQAEEARQQLAHASRLALMGEITASIAHEINQPLGAILSNADAAEMLLESSPPALDQVRVILGDIRKDDLRASEVIRRLRDLLKKRAMEIQPVDLNELTSEVVLLLRAESRRRGVRVDSEPADDLPLVRGDKVHLQQVMLNLVFNGMEAMAGMPGEMRLRVRTGVNENGSAEIAVSDTGPGILADRLPRLFDPFFSTKKEGMGLGLSIARSLVEAHGGQIWAENNPGGGATFRFTLPTGREQLNSESRGTLNASDGACT